MLSRHDYRVFLSLVAGALALVAFSLNVRPAHADRVELSLGSTTHKARSDSMDALGDYEITAVSLTAATRVPWLRLGSTEALFELGLDAGAMLGESFQTMETDTSLVIGSAGMRLRHSLTARLVASGRGALGLARLGVRLSDRASRVDALEDHAYTMSAQVAGALDFYLLRQAGEGKNPRMGLGLRAEVGYLAVAPVELFGTPESRDDSDVLRIPLAAASLGQLDPSAWTFRFAVIGRF